MANPAMLATMRMVMSLFRCLSVMRGNDKCKAEICKDSFSASENVIDLFGIPFPGRFLGELPGAESGSAVFSVALGGAFF